MPSWAKAPPSRNSPTAQPPGRQERRAHGREAGILEFGVVRGVVARSSARSRRRGSFRDRPLRSRRTAGSQRTRTRSLTSPPDGGDGSSDQLPRHPSVSRTSRGRRDAACGGNLPPRVWGAESQGTWLQLQANRKGRSSSRGSRPRHGLGGAEEGRRRRRAQHHPDLRK